MADPEELTIIVHNATGLKSKLGGGHRFFVVFGLSDTKYQTSVVVDNDGNPVWNEENVLTVHNTKDEVFLILREKDNVLGQILIPISSVNGEKEQMQKQALQPHTKCKKPQGELTYQCFVSKYRDSYKTFVEESKTDNINVDKRAINLCFFGKEPGKQLEQMTKLDSYTSSEPTQDSDEVLEITLEELIKQHNDTLGHSKETLIDDNENDSKNAISNGVDQSSPKPMSMKSKKKKKEKAGIAFHENGEIINSDEKEKEGDNYEKNKKKWFSLKFLKNKTLSGESKKALANNENVEVSNTENHTEKTDNLDESLEKNCNTLDEKWPYHGATPTLSLNTSTPDKDKSKWKLGKMSPPEITKCTPNKGPVDEATKVCIEGFNLGNEKADILSLKVAGCDCSDTVEFESPEKIYCKTHFQFESRMGPVEIITTSGGKGTLKDGYTFFDELEKYTGKSTPIAVHCQAQIENSIPRYILDQSGFDMQAGFQVSDRCSSGEHTIKSGSWKQTSVSCAPNLGIPCGCNKGQQVAFYCNDHQDIICGACKAFYHHKCKASSIQGKCSGFKSSKLNSVLAEIKSLKVKYERLKQESTLAKMGLNQLKEACKKDIKRFRKELDTLLDNLETNLLTELDKWEQDEDRRVDQDVTTIEAALNMLRVDCKRLEDAKIDGKKDVMFIADVQVSKFLQGYKRKLGELEKDIEKTTVEFERNKLLVDLTAGTDSLGCLKVQRNGHKQALKEPVKPYNTGSTKMLIDRKIKVRSEVNIRADDDNSDPWITGCVVMPNRHAVICERGNDQIKLLDDSWTITGRLELPDPWDVSVIDSSNVIVSSPDKKQLQKVQVFPKMKACRTIKLDRRCYGVAVSGEEIYTTCLNDWGQGEVRVLDLEGNLMRRLGVNLDRSYLFANPYYITVSASGKRLFVSDGSTDTITCLAPNGRVIYTYTYADRTEPRGLICDSGDNLLVCGHFTDNVRTINPDGNMYRTIYLPSQDGLCNPQCLAYKEREDTLIIGCYESNELWLLKLA